MIMRAIDGDSDWKWGKGKQSYSIQDGAIGENVRTRIMSFLGDCFFDLNAGIDWIRLLGSRNTQQEIKLRVKAMILQSYGVVRLNSLDVTFDSTARNLLLQYNIDTIFTSGVENTLEVGNA